MDWCLDNVLWMGWCFGDVEEGPFDGLCYGWYRVEVSTKLGKATAGGIRFFITFALIVIVVDSGGRCAELLTDSFPSSFGDSGVSSVVSAARAVETSWVMLSGLA